MQILREQVAHWGTLTAAANAMGWLPRDLKAAVARDADLAAEVEEALEEHKDALYMRAVQRGAHGQSDALLVKLLEAKLPEQFDPKARNTIATAKNKPTGVTLRRFEETADGKVVDVEDATIVEPAKPAPPAQPLRIGFVIL